MAISESTQEVDPSGFDGIPRESLDVDSTDMDYIIVGSGPGGSPLACRLAQAGMRVLVLEAGLDSGPKPLSPHLSPDEAEKVLRQSENDAQLYSCPGLHAASTESHLYPEAQAKPSCWGFEVRHYSRPESVSAPTTAYYPRASALGGCATHHALISIYGLDADWDEIASMTGDDSWSSSNMRTIYRRIERLSYGNSITWIGRYWNRFLDWVNPGRNAPGERGKDGWLDVTISKPDLALKDAQLSRLIATAFLDETDLSRPEKAWRWAKQLLLGRFYRDIDLNDAARMRENPEGIALIPIAVAPGGTRRGPREFLLETREQLREAQEHEMDSRRHNGRKSSRPIGSICIATGIFVHRVVLRTADDGGPPRAIGVEFVRGERLYSASLPSAATSDRQTERCFCRREVILASGAFNTPQILMLSGIGDPEHLKALSEQSSTLAHPLPPLRVPLPGVGENLMDRYEISVVSELKEEFSLLKGAKFRPEARDKKDTTRPRCPDDPAQEDVALKRWLDSEETGTRDGVYTSNGAVMAILKRSTPKLVKPDLFLLGFPAAFRGYYPGWSQDLLKIDARKPDGPLNRNLWSWTILKAYSSNRGTVRLKSLNPFQAPDIHFHYFDDQPDQYVASHQKGNADLDALVEAVALARRLNSGARQLVKAELQPGAGIPNDSEVLRRWIVSQTWGHHACGTCRIGSDPWRANPRQLSDRGAVLDSHFRVHGVAGLRVVDASVFPNIPGYFIATSVYMVSEKAAETILNELSL